MVGVSCIGAVFFLLGHIMFQMLDVLFEIVDWDFQFLKWCDEEILIHVKINVQLTMNNRRGGKEQGVLKKNVEKYTIKISFNASSVLPTLSNPIMIKGGYTKLFIHITLFSFVFFYWDTLFPFLLLHIQFCFKLTMLKPSTSYLQNDESFCIMRNAKL